ncbi:MAG: hypothetical protein OEZ59_08905, partial [Deltaproteobacteria bacterium]|nr:hypothetical protein [Deltaproteobacteria bacterium]
MISRHLSKILPAVLLLGLFPALAQAQMFLGEREALKQESRLELSHSTSDEKTETDAGVGLEVLTEKSRSNMAAI